jgi:superfamily I DNA/RNA helicase
MTTTDDAPEWLPDIEEEHEPEPQQGKIIESEEYPMRVLAGAGTGKTFTMVRKIEHLIDERNVSPDRILALTFTNNAADSMREKLNAKLGTAGYDIDAYTYHSVCNEILSEYAYEAGIDPGFEVISEAEKYAVVLDVLDDIEYRSVKPNVYDPDFYGSGAASALLSYIGTMKRTGVSPSEIDGFLGSAERLYELDDLPERIEEKANGSLRGRSVSSVSEGLPEMREFLIEQRDSLGDGGVESSVSEFLDRLVLLCDSFERVFEEHENGERKLPEAAHKLPAYLLGGYSGAPKGIPKMGLELPDFLGDFLENCKTARDLNAGYAAYERELDDRDFLDFDGLVAGAVELLETDVAAELSGRWDYVFCDEFQDTDRLQFDLVTSLVSDERLFVVGDDDQAIYEWRGAHVDNITDELDDHFGDALVDEPLEENFRSRQPILDLANNAIERLEGRGTEKELTRVEEPDYEGDTVAVVREAEEENERAEQSVNVVRNLLSGECEELDRDYSPGEIAVLVRKSAHAEPILERFNEEGVPYQVAGSLSSESVGVGTVVAYLKALARPEEDEVSWNRVLTMRYRLRDEDLRRLNAHEDGVLEGLREVELNEFVEPRRIEEAREDIEHLLDLRDRVSLGRLYRELKEVTRVEWYLSEQERRDLTQLDDFVGEYGDDAVQPHLSREFIEALGQRDSLLESGGSSPTSQPELSDDAVNVMTLHKSKGLDFPVVLIPRLTADEWGPSSRDYDALEEAVTDEPEAAFGEDFVERDAREQRRLLHVGITRAEEVLVLSGGSDGEGGGNADEMVGFTEEVLPAPWKPGSGDLPVWDDLLDTLPTDAADWTDTLATEVVGDLGGRVLDGEDEVSTKEGRDRVLALARSSLEGGVETETGEKTFELDRLVGPSTPGPAIRHSYTSLETYEDCSRKHYLDYVVNAFADYNDEENGATGVSQREIGVLFHDTAEMAAQGDASDRDGWYEICERLAKQRRAQDALGAAKDCIDRYFGLGISDWKVVDAERDFELDVDGHDLVGFIDAVYRTPDDELVVVDYKATDRRRDLDDDRQLPIYLLACRDLYDEPVSRAGYAYVGEIGPDVDTKEFDDETLDTVLSDIKASMESISDATFTEYNAGEHCRWCRHNQLPCADEGLD